MSAENLEAAKRITESKEATKKCSPIHDTANSGHTSRIIPYADDAAMGYLENRARAHSDSRKDCVLTETETLESRKHATNTTLAELTRLCASVGEPVRLRSFIEFIGGTSKAPGQVAHMDIYGLAEIGQADDNEEGSGSGWNCSWVIAGSKGTIIKQYPYQGFPDNFTKTVSTLPSEDWNTLPNVQSTWDAPGTVLMFRANHIHAGASGERVVGFACQDTIEDVEDHVITHAEVFEGNKLGLPRNAPEAVKQAVKAAASRHKGRQKGPL